MKFDREEAVKIAMNEIWKNGYEAASVKSLSERLQITRSSFYNTFGSREKLFREAFALYASETPDCALYALTPEMPLKPALTRLFREICRVRAADPEHRGCLAINCAAELLPGAGEVSDHIAQALGSSAGLILEKVEWAIERGELPPDTDAKSMAGAIQNLMIGTNLQSKVVHDEAALWAAASLLLKSLDLLEEPHDAH